MTIFFITKLHIHLVYFRQVLFLPVTKKEPQWKKLYWWTSSEASTKRGQSAPPECWASSSPSPVGLPHLIFLPRHSCSHRALLERKPTSTDLFSPPLTPPYNSRNSLPDPQPLWKNHAFLFRQETACFEERKSRFIHSLKPNSNSCCWEPADALQPKGKSSVSNPKHSDFRILYYFKEFW